MAEPLSYTDLRGRKISLANLEAEELQLIVQLQRRAEERPDWNDFDNFWLPAVATFYEGRGFSRPEVIQTAAWRIAQDLSSRIAAAAGFVRLPDYRDELEEIIRTRFRTRRTFCAASGLSEDMLSHVLARRKHLAIDTLTEALRRIGYTLRILSTDQDGQVEGNGAAKSAVAGGVDQPAP